MSGVEVSEDIRWSTRLTENDKKKEEKSKAEKENGKKEHLKAKIGEKRKEMAKEREKKSAEKKSESQGVKSKKAKTAKTAEYIKEVPTRAHDNEVDNEEVDLFPELSASEVLKDIKQKTKSLEIKLAKMMAQQSTHLTAEAGTSTTQLESAIQVQVETNDSDAGSGEPVDLDAMVGEVKQEHVPQIEGAALGSGAEMPIEMEDVEAETQASGEDETHQQNQIEVEGATSTAEVEEETQDQAHVGSPDDLDAVMEEVKEENDEDVPEMEDVAQGDGSETMPAGAEEDHGEMLMNDRNTVQAPEAVHGDETSNPLISSADSILGQSESSPTRPPSDELQNVTNNEMLKRSTGKELEKSGRRDDESAELNSLTSQSDSYSLDLNELFNESPSQDSVTNAFKSVEDWVDDQDPLLGIPQAAAPTVTSMSSKKRIWSFALHDISKHNTNDEDGTDDQAANENDEDSADNRDAPMPNISQQAPNPVEINDINIIKSTNQFTVITPSVLTRLEQVPCDVSEALAYLEIEAAVSEIECKTGRPVQLYTKEVLYALHFTCTDRLARLIENFIDCFKNGVKPPNGIPPSINTYGVARSLSHEGLVLAAFFLGFSRALHESKMLNCYTPAGLIIPSEDGNQIRQVGLQGLITEFPLILEEAMKKITRRGQIGSKNIIKKIGL